MSHDMVLVCTRLVPCCQLAYIWDAFLLLETLLSSRNLGRNWIGGKMGRLFTYQSTRSRLRCSKFVPNLRTSMQVGNRTRVWNALSRNRTEHTRVTIFFPDRDPLFRSSLSSISLSYRSKYRSRSKSCKRI